MDYQALKDLITSVFIKNGRGEITADNLREIALAMVDSLGEVYPHTYTDEQKAQARANIDALSNHDGAITEGKLDTALTAKVNNNVKTVEQALSDDEVRVASKNLKFRDDNGNVFLNSPFINFEGNNVRDNLICYSERNEFTEYGGNSSNTILCSMNNSFGDDFQGNLCLFASNNNFGSDVVHDNVFGPCFDQNEIWGDLYNSVFGSGCVGNYIKGGYSYLKFDSGVSFVELANNSLNIAEHIHVLSGVKGKSSTERLVINIPDEYLGSSRELIITTKRTDRGISTPEDIVMYYADEVVDKQNKQDNTLATTSKEVVGAINELFNGGVKDASIVGAKLASGTITSSNIADKAIKTKNIADKAIQTKNIADKAISPDNLNAAVTDIISNTVKYDKVQTLTDAQKLQARRNIGALNAAAGAVHTVNLANDDVTTEKLANGAVTTPKITNDAVTTEKVKAGAVTKAKLSTEVQAILDDVANKQNITDESLATTSKEVVGAINELFNGGVKDKSIEVGKLAQAVQDTIGKVGMNVKVLPAGTDLLSPDFEDGIWIVDCSKMTNVPSSITKSDYDYALSLLIVDREHKKVMLFGLDTNSTKYPTCAYRHLAQKSWNNTPKSIFSELSSLQLSVIDKQNKQDNTLATTSKEVVGAINELFNGGVKDKSIEVGKLAQAVQDTLKMVGTNVKEVKIGEDLFSLEDGIYSLNGSTYTNYPIGIPFDASSVCILVVTHSNQRATLYGVDGSHSSPILPLVAIGDLTNKRWTGGSFYSFFASDYEVGHKLDQKLDNTSSLTDTEVNNIWDNN